jgi:hypothetical protein
MVVLLAACAPRAQQVSGPAVRLTAGAGDTVIVNSSWPTRLPVRAVDAAGGTVAGAPIRFQWAGGDSLAVDTTGAVTCTRRGDLLVHAALGSLATRVLVRCRPVKYVRIPGPIQFVLGDSELTRPRALPVEAYGANGRRVALIAGSAWMGDSSVAALHGLTVYPRSRGITIASAHVGDGDAGTGVHVYQRVDTLAALDTLLRVRPQQRLLAVPLRLASGEFRRQRLPRGGWMLTMLPEDEEHDPNAIRLRVEGAHCQPHFLNAPRRFGCGVDSAATVIVYRVFSNRSRSVVRGYLLVRWLFG